MTDPIYHSVKHKANQHKSHTLAKEGITSQWYIIPSKPLDNYAMYVISQPTDEELSFQTQKIY